jgi:hypothetical protein
MSTRTRPPEQLTPGYHGTVGRWALRVRRAVRRVRCVVRNRVGTRRTFPLAPEDMRLAYGYRRALLLALAAVGLAGLGGRLFATELFRSLVSRNLLLVTVFNGLISVLGLGTAVAYQRLRRWTCRAATRFAAFVDAAGAPRRRL